MAVNKLQKSEGSTLNLPVNVTGALCYIPWVGWVAGIVVLLLEKNPGLRWHAVQGLVLMASLVTLTMVMGLTIVLIPLVGFVSVGGLIVQVFAAVKVYSGDKPRFYKISDWTDAIIKKLAI